MYVIFGAICIITGVTGLAMIIGYVWGKENKETKLEKWTGNKS